MELIDTKLKYASSIVAGGTPSTTNDDFWSGDIPWIDSGKVNYQIIKPKHVEKYISKEALNKTSSKLIKKNSPLIAITGATCSTVGYLTFDCAVNQSILGFHVYKNFDSKYIYFVLISLKDQILSLRSGGAQGGVTKTDIENIKFKYVNHINQRLVANYLDKKTNQIDLLIKKIQKKIKLLEEQRTSLISHYITKGIDPNIEMKESGVKWIEKIPKHWLIKKVNHVTSSIGSGTTPKSDNRDYYDNGTFNWLVTGDLNDGEVTETSNKITERALSDHTSLKTYSSGSLMIAMYGATIGKLGILRTESSVNQATCVVTFDVNNDVEFWFNVFLGHRKYIVSLGYGGGQPNISQDLIKGLRFPCPPNIKEQKKVVSVIKEKLGKHDDFIKKEIQRYKLLQEYRRSLISSVITGKIKIDENLT